MRAPMPPDIHNVYIYEAFNTASWSVVLGSPMLLFFQNLKATATVLAISACLAPVLNILQLPAAYYVERIGYRRFVLSGWTMRSCVVVGMMVVALLPERVDAATRMILMLGLSLIYTTMRGISSAGFSAVVHAHRAGEPPGRVSRQGPSLRRAGGDHVPLRVGGVITTHRLGIPSGGVRHQRRVRLLQPGLPAKNSRCAGRENHTESKSASVEGHVFLPAVFQIRLLQHGREHGARIVGRFLGALFRVSLHASNSVVLYVAGATMLVVALNLVMIGPLLDRTGNKPALTLSGLFFIFHFFCWGLVAAGILPASRQ